MENFDDWFEKEFMRELERTLELEEMSYREFLEKSKAEDT